MTGRMELNIWPTLRSSANVNRTLLATDLLQIIGAENSERNVIFSPASIQTCLALAYFGADGETAEEMRTTLRLGHGTREDLAENFKDFIKSAFESSNSSDDKPQLGMANRIYLNQNVDIKPEFNEIAAKYFETQSRKINFGNADQAVQVINDWIEVETNFKIKNLLHSNSVNGDTSVVLVNAIYFKAKWAFPFSAGMTHKADFVENGKNIAHVDTMTMDEWVAYADFEDLDAKALELMYKNTELTMLFLLPNKKDGLAELEKNLAGKDLNELSTLLQGHKVDIFIPKFRIEFDIELKEPLEELGLKSMFTDAADFTSLFETPTKIAEVKHKAYIDVNEAGSEAAAATYSKVVSTSMDWDQKTFRADHPFVFAIRSPKAVYFTGHVTKI